MEKKTRVWWFALSICQPTGYDWSLLRRDVVAGLTVTAVAIPQSMAYALLAGVSPIYGLYTAIIMTALGSLFGSSAYLINGPTNAISLVVFGVVARVGGGPDDPNRIALVGALSVAAGLIQILLALVRLGGLARHVPDALVVGFMAGAGVLVALTQIPAVLGLQEIGTGEDHLLVRLWLTWRRGGSIDLVSLATCSSTVVLIVGLHRLGSRVGVKLPEMLLSLVLVSSLVALLHLTPAGGRAGHLHIESTLPTLRLPDLAVARLDQLSRFGGGALAVALVGLIEALAMARSLSVSSGQPLDYNRQSLAEGLANLGGGLFGCLPGSGSLSRSAINYYSGAATRLSGVFSAAGVAAALWLFAPFSRFVPRAALAGILIFTAWRIVEPRRLLEFLRSSPSNATIVLSTACAAGFVGIVFALLAGLASC
jgi:SulP family sulfate permease